MKKRALVYAIAAAVIVTMAGCSAKASSGPAAAGTSSAEAGGTKAADTAAESGTSSAAGTSSAINPDSRLAKIRAAGKIVMATSPDFAPSEFKDVSSGKTEYVGSDIELGKYIADQLGVKFEVRAMEFSAIQQALISGSVDMGISGFARTEERAKTLGLSDGYNKAPGKGQGILIMKEKAAEYTSAESFAGKKIAAQNASLQQNLIKEQLPSDVKLQPVTSITDGVMMLTTGKVDALAVAGDNGEMLMKAYPDVVMSDFKFAYESEGTVIAVKKGENELLEAINGAIAKVNESGVYEQWKEEAIALAESLGVEVN